MRFGEKLRILADAQGDSALLSLAGANLLLCDRPTKDQENLREALQVAAVPHWVDEEILAICLSLRLAPKLRRSPHCCVASLLWSHFQPVDLEQ